MTEIKHRSMPVRNTVKVSEIIGKRVRSKDGSDFGRVEEMHVDPEGLKIEGINVVRGLFKESVYIGKNYIKSLNKQGAMLTITPVKDLKGHDVIDNEGVKVGKVKSVKMMNKTNNIESIVVNDNGNEISVPWSSINEIGERVMLNKRFGKKMK